MIDYCIKVPVFRIKSNKEFKDKGYQSIYFNEKLFSNKNYETLFLIDYLLNCRVDEKGLRKNLEGNNIDDDEIIYMYGNKYHSEKSLHQLDENIFVIKRLINGSGKDVKKDYKYLLIQLLNILKFARYDYMIFPKDAFNNISSFKKFMREYFNITVPVKNSSK